MLVDPRKYFRYDNESNLLVRLSNGKKCISKASGSAYVKVYADGNYFQYHNAVWVCCNGEIPNGMTVDHKDGNKLNNHIGNLRLANMKQQVYNTKAYGKGSKYKGVCFSKKHQKWYARIIIEGKYMWLGIFSVEEDAAKAYKAAAEKYHKEFVKIETIY